MTLPAVLALDLGTSSVKALLIDSTARVLATASAPYLVYRPREGWAEQDPDEWWQATLSVTRDVIALAETCEVVAIGISGQMHGTVLIDGAGVPVRPAIIWEDRRSAEDVRTLTEGVGAERIIELCGSPLATGFQAATLAWLHEHEPAAMARAATVLLPGDYLRFRLTGERVTEPSGASSTLLFDIATGDWSPTMLSALELGRTYLPDVGESAAISGSLTRAAAGELGLEAGIPVAGGGGDAPLAALAAGATQSDTLLVTMSTGSQAILPADTPVTDPEGRLHTWCSVASPGSGLPPWYQMGATLASGRALRWLREEVLAGSAPPLEASISSLPPGSDGLLFLPYLSGERTPHMDPDASGAFLGLRVHHGPAHLSRAVMEGSVFALLDAYGVLREQGGQPARIVLAGGGARSRTWTQIVSDVFHLPVDPLEESEGSAMGAAIVAATAIGWFDLVEGSTASARYAPRVEPRSEAAAIYADLYTHFANAYPAFRDDFHALGQIAARARALSINT